MNKRTLRAAIGKCDGSTLTLRNRAAEVSIERLESRTWRGARYRVGGAIYPTPERAMVMALHLLACYNEG